MDDEALVRSGFRMILEAADDIEEVAAVDGVAAIERTRPDVVLLDIRMPGRSGPDILAEVRARPAPPVVAILTTFDDDVATALGRGAAGFLVEDTDPAQPSGLVRSLAAGGIVLSPQISQTVIHGYLGSGDRHAAAPLGALTAREREVLPGTCRGPGIARIRGRRGGRGQGSPSLGRVDSSDAPDRARPGGPRMRRSDLVVAAVAVGGGLLLVGAGHGVAAVLPTVPDGTVGFFQRATVSVAETGDQVSFVAPEGWMSEGEPAEGDTEARYTTDDGATELVVSTADPEPDEEDALAREVCRPSPVDAAEVCAWVRLVTAADDADGGAIRQARAVADSIGVVS